MSSEGSDTGQSSRFSPKARTQTETGVEEHLGESIELTQFLYERSEKSLNNQREDADALDRKASKIIRFIGVVMTIGVTSAVGFLRYLSNTGSVTMKVQLINEYTISFAILTVLSLAFAMKAYHETTIITAPTPETAVELYEKESLEKAQAKLMNLHAKWRVANEKNHKSDLNDIFLSQMLLFYGLASSTVGIMLSLGVLKIPNRELMFVVLLAGGLFGYESLLQSVADEYVPESRN